MKAVVLANGAYPSHEIPLRLLQEAEMVVCCDGAANEYISRGGMPTAIVGDGDSIDPRHRFLLHRMEEQDDNDLTKAVHYLREQGITEIDILGATGKREDHTLANISLLIEYLKEGIEVRMFTDEGVFLPCLDHADVEGLEIGQPISIFNFGATDFQSDGLLYSLYDFNNWWQGTLNEAVSEKVSIRAKGYFLVFLTY